MITETCQRWTEGRESRRPAGEVIRTSSYGTVTRDRAVETLCGWVSCQNVIAFGETLRAARAELPAALELLGASL